MAKLNRLTVAAIAFAIAFAAFLPAAKAGCRHLFVQKVVAVPVYAAPQIYYRAGADIEAEALAEKVARLVTQKLSANQTLQQAAPSNALLSQKCASCHNGDKAFDIRGGLSDSQKVSWMKMLGLNEGVPPEMKPIIASLQAQGGADVTAEVLKQPAARTEPETGVLQ